MSGLHLFMAGREQVPMRPKNVTSERHEHKEDLGTRLNFPEKLFTRALVQHLFCQRDLPSMI